MLQSGVAECAYAALRSTAVRVASMLPETCGVGVGGALAVSVVLVVSGVGGVNGARGVNNGQPQGLQVRTEQEQNQVMQEITQEVMQEMQQTHSLQIYSRPLP
jgi:hypothetical protein